MVHTFAPTKFNDLLKIVIKKGGGNRPCEALATLRVPGRSSKKVLNSTPIYFGER